MANGYEMRWGIIISCTAGIPLVSFEKGNAFAETRHAFYDNGITSIDTHPHPPIAISSFPSKYLYSFALSHVVMLSPRCVIVSAFTISLKSNVIVNSHQISQVQKMMEILFEDFSHILILMCINSRRSDHPSSLFVVALSLWVCVYFHLHRWPMKWILPHGTPHNGITTKIICSTKMSSNIQPLVGGASHKLISNNNKLMWLLRHSQHEWCSVSCWLTKNQTTTTKIHMPRLHTHTHTRIILITNWRAVVYSISQTQSSLGSFLELSLSVALIYSSTQYTSSAFRVNRIFLCNLSGLARRHIKWI